MFPLATALAGYGDCIERGTTAGAVGRDRYHAAAAAQSTAVFGCFIAYSCARFGIIRGMRMTPNALPEDIDALKSLVAEQATANEQLLLENRRIKAQVLTLQEQLNIAIAIYVS